MKSLYLVYEKIKKKSGMVIVYIDKWMNECLDKQDLFIWGKINDNR